MKRTEKQREIAEQEKPILEKVLSWIPKNRLWLLVSYRHEKMNYSERFHQKEIFPRAEWVSKIFRVEISGHRKNGKPIILTGTRSKKAVRAIIKHNESFNKK